MSRVRETEPIEDRQFQHQQHQPALAEPAQKLASRSRARHRVPSGTQSHGPRVPGRRNPASRLSRGLAWREALERRGDPRAVDAGCDPCRLARRRLRRAMPLSRGGRQRRARRLDLRSERKPAARSQIRVQARLGQTLAPPPGGALRAGGARVVAGGDHSVAAPPRHLSTNYLGPEPLFRPRDRPRGPPPPPPGGAGRPRAPPPKKQIYVFGFYAQGGGGRGRRRRDTRGRGGGTGLGPRGGGGAGGARSADTCEPWWRPPCNDADAGPPKKTETSSPGGGGG